MGAVDIPFFSFLFFLVFLVPVMVLNYRLGLKVNLTMLTAMLRMGLQLGFVGVYLKFIFQLDCAALNIAYLLIMVLVASHSVLRTVKLRLRIFFIPVFIALFIPFSVLLLFFTKVVVPLDNAFSAAYLVPVGGMLLGNCLRSIIIGLGAFFEQIRKDEATYLYTLSLFNRRTPALKPFFQNAFSSAISPTMATMATIGLVSLPGMMTGQMLGGSIPTVAIKYQIAIMFSIFFTEYFSTLLAILISIRSAFDGMDCLRHEIFATPSAPH